MRDVLRFAAVAICIALASCGSGEHQPTSEDKVAEAVSDVSGDAASFPDLFVESAEPTPEQRAQYSKYSYNATDVSIEGDTATVTVDIISPFTDQSVGQAEWKCQRVDGAWRIQAAPLPEALP